MDYDTFWTVGYRNCWIHGKYNRTLQREEITARNPATGVNIPHNSKTLAGVKRAITKHLKEQSSEQATHHTPLVP